MNSQPSSEDKKQQTIVYYEEQAQRFCADTQVLDMSMLYERYLRHLTPDARILDAGCGSGRDSLHFLERGYDVVAFDAALAMVEYATKLIGQPVLRLTFDELAFEEEFDGIWACASLLHVPHEEMPDVLTRLAHALKSSGILYASFKYGEGETFRHGRLFNDYTEDSFQMLIDEHSQFELIEMWRTVDIRPERTDSQWLNVILRASWQT